MRAILERLRLGAVCAVFLHIVALPAVAQIDTPVRTAPAPAGSPSGPRAAQPLALTNVTVIDVRDGTRHRNRTVVIDGTRIAAVGPSGDVAIPNGALVVDARGRYLIPGLWDMHVHSAGAAERDLPVYLALGITGVRNMHTSADTALELVAAIKRRIADGTLRGPRFIANGAIVDGPMPIHPGSIALGTPAAARAAVDSLAAAGADFIKVYDRLPRDVYLAIGEQAKLRGIPFVGHLPSAVRVAEAAIAGQRGIEHAGALSFECSPRGDSIRADLLAHPVSSYEEWVRTKGALARTWTVERCASAIEALRRNGTWFTPTLAVYWGAVHADSVLANARALAVVPVDVRRRWEADARESPEWRRDADAAILEAGTNTVRALHRAGVPLLAGTDTGNPLLIPGYSLHKELELLVSAGLTRLEALQTATINPARFLEATDSLGAVERGKLADLVLLDGDPLADIRNTRRIRAVVANGRYYDRAALDALLVVAR